MTCCYAKASLASDHRSPAPECPLVRIEMERLPDLNIPRFDHETFCIDGEIFVVGGHTSGFVPTATAERYRDGKWEQMATTYSHDGGLFLRMRSGKLLVAGGFEKPLGIGQTFNAEEYDPATGRFNGFASLDMKRAYASAIELDSGKVLIAGNWYAGDGMEIFDIRKETFTFAKDVSIPRCSPYIFRIAAVDAVVFGYKDNKGSLQDTIIVDRLLGDAFTVPLFETWKPSPFYPVQLQHGEAFIGDEQQGIYAYLFPVVNKDGQVAIAQMRSVSPANGSQVQPEFSLLPTDFSVPMKTAWSETINYYGGILYDRKTKKAYMCGVGNDIRYYVLCIDCAALVSGGKASLTLFYTDVIKGQSGFGQPTLDDDGNLVVVGGTLKNNFSPSASAMILHLHQPGKAAKATAYLWPWGASALLLIAIVATVFILRKRRAASISFTNSGKTATPLAIENNLPETAGDHELVKQVVGLMEKEKLYLNSGLSVNDVALRLGVHRNQVSHCINAAGKTTFAQFINGYRIAHAQQLLRNHPDMKMTAVYMESGFSSEASFFRAFKALTGKTPREWIGQ